MNRLAVFANVYDTPYIHDWRKGIASQIDMDFEIVYYLHEELNGALARILDDYDNLLFLDIDDIPQPALISTAKQYMDYDVVGFGMRMFGDREGVFGFRKAPIKYNVYGFGNTMYSVDAIEHLMPLTTDYDTAQRAFYDGFAFEFVDLPLIHYRQYGQNDNIIEVEGGRAWRI